MVAVAQVRSDVGLGASEVSAALNLNPYRSAYELWQEKIGEREPFAGNDNTRWGQLIEDAARTAYVEKTGYALHVPPASLFSPTIEWARATPDAVVVESAAWQHLVQIKNTGYWPGQQWKHGPPEHVVLQEQWEMFVTGLVRADVVVSLGGGFPEIFTVHRDEQLIADMVRAADKFWRQVQSRIPPAVDESDECRAYWSARGREAAIEGVVVPFDLCMAISEEFREAWLGARAATKRLKIAKGNVLRLAAEAGAEGLEATDGNIMLQRRSVGGKPAIVNWEAVARLVASGRMKDDEFRELVDANTKPGTPGGVSLAVKAPTVWGKEIVE